MNITLIGCGNMGSKLAERLSPSHKLFLFDRNPSKAEHLHREGFGEVILNLKDALKHSDIVILAVKPQNLKEAVPLIEHELKSNHTLISLLAGTTISTLKHSLSSPKIIRMMPNIAIAHGEGLIALATEENLPGEEKDRLTKMCEPLGKVYWIPESKIDAFTSLAGSGPAFVFAIIEAMVDAGISMGFNAADSQKIVNQMIKGSVVLLEKTSKHPGELKWSVASPEGTTIAGLKKLEEQAVRGSIINIFIAAFDRAKQLSRR